MTNEERGLQLQQLANIVIDAYLNRGQQFTPNFQTGVEAVIFLSRPKGNQDHPGLRTDVWYERSDYEPTVTQLEEETKRRSKK
jgi:hypothetical protein